MKTLKRYIIIREHDYPKFEKRALKNKLYDRVEFIPSDIRDLEHEITIALLKDPDYLKQLDYSHMPGYFWHSSPAVRQLARKIQLMYNTQYAEWIWEVENDTGHIYIQAKSNAPRTRIGVAWVEKDL